MKRFLIYFLIAGYSLSNPSSAEFFKMPFIGIHYLEHHSRNPNLTFPAFIAMHYMGKDLKDNDTDRDMKLPFKKMIHTHHSVLLIQNLSDVRVPKNAFRNIKNIGLIDHFMLKHAFLEQQFRPPQYS